MDGQKNAKPGSPHIHLDSFGGHRRPSKRSEVSEQAEGRRPGGFRRSRRPPEAPGGPRRPGKRDHAGSKPGRKGEWEFRALAPETPKGIKLGGCLRKQGVGKRKPTHPVLGLLGTRKSAVARHAAPPHPLNVSGRPFPTCDPSARRAARRPKP